ncbi:MAG: molybdenum cofactor biosynthesis protein MoaE [Pseudomonadota bacterium]
MACAISVSVVGEQIDPARVFDAFDTSSADDDGAIAQFCGRCRGESGRLAALEIEHYPGMAEAQIKDAASNAASRWPISRIIVVHRHGKVHPGETIVMVLAASRHREAALEAVQYVMDYLKTDAPFWKREWLTDGTQGPWVEAKASDDKAHKRWEQP